MPKSPTPPEDRSTCTPCRGTGTVISGLGGAPHEVTCPWCEGTGKWQPGHDAVAVAAGNAGGGPPAS